jgi:hypothetical protein
VIGLSEPSAACLRKTLGIPRLTPPPAPATARMIKSSGSGKLKTTPDGNPSPMNRPGTVEFAAVEVATEGGLELGVESEKEVLEPLEFVAVVKSAAVEVDDDARFDVGEDSENDVLETVASVAVVEMETAEARVFDPAELDPRSVLVLVLDVRLSDAIESCVVVEMLSETDDVAELLDKLVTVARLSSEVDGVEAPVDVVWVEALSALVDDAAVPRESPGLDTVDKVPKFVAEPLFVDRYDTSSVVTVSVAVKVLLMVE